MSDWVAHQPKFSTLVRCNRSTGTNGRGRRKACHRYVALDGMFIPPDPPPPVDACVCGKHRRRLARRRRRLSAGAVSGTIQA